MTKGTLSLTMSQFIELNKEICEWTELCNEDIAKAIYEFMTCRESEDKDNRKIALLLSDSLGCTNIKSDSKMDFLHFIRYMNIIYKSDFSERIKFFYGISTSGNLK